MEVQLYVYDLSRGLARQMSQGFLGTQIDAVYHTAIILNNVEYFFGAGVQTCLPGATHHGQPMERIPLGKTQLPMDVILEYLESLKEVYTAASYDLFMHNCNNFSNDFAMFLVGKGIPSHITSLPQTVLNTPFGQMLKPQLDQAMRGVTQAPVSSPSVPNQIRRSSGVDLSTDTPTKSAVNNVSDMTSVNRLLERSSSSCAVIFFTSSTCPPCKACYKPFESLAQEYNGQASFLKVDINVAVEVGSHFKIRATPTFLTFLNGEKYEEWSGADPMKLKNNVAMLIRMAHSPHSHLKMKIDTYQKPSKVCLYNTIPPIEKIISKLGQVGISVPIQHLKRFVENRKSQGAADAAVPDMQGISSYIKSQIELGYTDSIFALIDLLRVAAIDPRISGFLVEDNNSMVWKIFESVCDWENAASTATKLCTVQLACNIFSTPLLYHKMIEGDETLIRLGIWLLLDGESSEKVKEGAATLLLNMAVLVHSQRLEGRTVSLSEDHQVEFAVALLESVQRDEQPYILRRVVFTIGLLCFMCPSSGELRGIIDGMGAANILVHQASLSKAIDKTVLDDTVQIVS